MAKKQQLEPKEAEVEPQEDSNETPAHVPRHEHHLADEDRSTRGGALSRGDRELPDDTPDTQESLGSPDGAYRIDEDEGHGLRHPTPITSADGDKVIYLGELDNDSD